MKNPSHPGIGTCNSVVIRAGAIAAWLALVPSSAPAATLNKANNTTDLNLPASWLTTAPGPADIAQWTSTVTAANSTLLGSDLAWAGIKIVSPGGLVTLGAGNTLTVGASGIDLSTATQNLTLSCGLALQGKQSWKAAAGRTLNVAGTFTRGRAVVDFTSFTATATLGTLANESSGMLGPWATTGSTTSLNYVKSTAGVIAAYTGQIAGQIAGTAGTLANVTNPAANYSFGAAATQTGAITGNTLRFTGAAAVLANAGFTTTLNGLMHAGTGALTISGAGNLVIGANRELVIVTNAQATIISNPIVNHSGGASALTYSGSGVLTLSGVNTYSGGTTVNAGTFTLGNRNGLGGGLVTLAAATTFQQANFEGSTADGALPNVFYLSGSGNVTINFPSVGGKDIWLGQAVAGTGGLTVQGGARALTLAAGNTFSGGVRLTNADHRVVIFNASSLGTGTFRSERTVAGSGMLESAADLSAGPGVVNAFDIASGAYLNIHADGSNHLLLAGPIGNPLGIGNLYKDGTATLTLAGPNTYTGATKVAAGTLACSSACSLRGGALDISSGATARLDFTGTRRVASLTLGGTAQTSNGTYGSATSGATYQSGFFAGPGTVTVGPAFASTSTTLVMSGSGTPASAGSALAFTATVEGSAPTDQVAFYDGVTRLGTGTLNASFQATFTTSSLALGAHAITARYEGNAANDPSVSSALDIQIAEPATILSFTFPGLPATTISGNNISVTVPYATAVTALVPTYTIFPGATGNPPSGSIQDFTSPVHYVVTGQDASQKDYAVTVNKTPASSAMDILTFVFPGLSVPTIGANTIALTVPLGTDVTALAPTYTVSSLALQDATFPSGTIRDFSTPQTYTVTAENGSTKVYTVAVTTYQSWTHSGSLYILTTPDGANLPASAAEETNFPLLVRLNSGNFPFSQAQSDGRDIRFTTAGGVDISYQIEQWDAVNGQAAVWLKIPTITGNSRQEIKMYWGKPDAPSQSSGANVFNAANGYVCVFHLNDTLTDAVGTLTPTPANGGPSLASGIIGKGRTFTAGQGVNCGDNLTTLPSGNTSHSTQVWFRSGSSNFDIVDWAREDAGNKVQVRLLSPPRIYIDGNFASVTGTSTLTTGQWHQVVHTYSAGTPGTSRIYVDGLLDASDSVTMNITPPSIMRLGGWYNTYQFVGAMDEVRLSNVTRSANWIKLEYENQKVQQTLVGTLVQPGSTFAVDPTSLTIDENAGAILTAQAGGAQKVYWIEKKGGVDTVLATDQFSLDISAGRVTGDQSYVIRFQGIYPTETKTIDIPVTITETVPDPVFTLTGPNTWNGRDTIEVTPDITNLAAMQAAGAGTLNYSWSVNGVAVIKQVSGATLTLLRSQGGGAMTVSLTIDNGGTPVTATKTITVQEPASDAWVQRTPGTTEKPVNSQFFARDPNTNMGTIHYNGTGAGTAPVYLKVFATPAAGTEAQYGVTLRQTPVAGAYAFTVPIAAGKVTYRVEFGTTTTDGVDNPPSATVTNLICGDAFIIEGQSNALATDNGEANAPAPSPWIRSYGKKAGWGNAVNKGSELQLGVWGIILAQRLLADNNMPVCIINGAVGGTRIDVHRPNPANHSVPLGSGYGENSYADLYNRIVGAKLTHGIRAVMWHQGEQDQGSGGPDGDYDYKFYQQYFVDISAAWKADFPNILNYYIFQIWPAACGDTSRNDQLREVQRTLPNLYSNMRIMSTVGIVPGSSCHYALAGYQVFSDLLAPMLQQDIDNYMPTAVFTAANLNKAYFTTATKNEIALEFDQNVAWNPGAPTMLFLANSAGATSGSVSSGSATGNTIKLQLSGASSAVSITYLKGGSWNQANLLYGTNGIAALTFADVPIGTLSPYEIWAANAAQGLTAGVNDGPLMDPDFDGVENLLEFVLRTAPMTPSTTALPAIQQDGGQWTFEYDRNDDSLPPATTQVVEYGDSLTGWTPVSIPATSSGAVTITPGSPSDHVKVTLPNPGTKLFVRLKVANTPP